MKGNTVKTQREDSHLQTEERGLRGLLRRETNPANPLIVDAQSPALVENKFLLFKP